MNAEIDKIPLRDIHLPDPVSWWPLAPGWWIVLLVVLIAIVWYARYRKHSQLRRLKSQALREYAAINEQFLNNKDPILLAQKLSALLRRCSISRYPDMNISAITGKKWLEFLDQGIPQKEKIGKLRFVDGVGEALTQAPYFAHKSHANYDANLLLKLCHCWLRHTLSTRHIKRKNLLKANSIANDHIQATSTELHRKG